MTILDLADRYHTFRRSALAGRATRYTVGSLIAAGVSAVVFAALFASGVGTTPCTIVAFIAGAIPNWVLNRRWAWKRRGRPLFGREVLGYVVTSIVSLAASSAATAWTHDQVRDLNAPHALRIALVTASYLVTFLLLFVAKFVIYEVWIFSERRRLRDALRSRRQVPTMTRANRTP